jgi:spore coat protein CotH
MSRVPPETTVAVLMGGWSAEREVSLSSGKSCLAALTRAGFRTVPVDVQRDSIVPVLQELKPDVAFNALHGKWGEDGCCAAILETLQIPYTHSGVLASALAMDKPMAKRIFAAAGIPCAQTAFYRVFIDFGSGLRYCGVYTGIELPDDHMIKQQFGEENGNIYKPESNLTSFNISLFEKKNNETTANYSDVQQLVTILNSPIRTTAAAQWRTQLEAVFNVNHFLRYLAINNGMVNWDSYGVMAHNFYLYNHSVVKLTWIPWDHNESLSGNPGITGTTGGGGPAGRSGLSLSMNEVAASWPLIRYLADDPVYMQTYKDRLKEFRNSVLLESSMHAMFDKYHGMISPFATGANGEQAGATYLTGGTTGFANALSDLKTHISNRRALIANYVP